MRTPTISRGRSIHPILDWTREAILAYLAEHDLPINEDHWDPTKGRDQCGECLIGDNCGLDTAPADPAIAIARAGRAA